MIKVMISGIMLASVAVLGVSHTSYALHTTDSLTQSLLGRAPQGEEQVQGVADRKAQRQAELDAKRQAIEQQIADRRAAVAEKLSGERAERCEKKEPTINQILDNRVTAAQRHFDKLKMINEKLAAFVTDKELRVHNEAAFELILTEKQGDAEAMIDTVKTLDFECTIADANAPGLIVKDQFSDVKQALQGYRTAIKDYALAVRGAATAAVEGAATGTNQSSGTQTETDTSTGTDNQEPAQ